MKRSLFVVGAAALSTCTMVAVTSVAWAHTEISPSEVPAGASQEFTLSLAQEKDVPTTEIRMEVSQGFEVSDVGSPSGWQGNLEAGSVVWSGGEIGPNEDGAEFPFTARAPGEAGEFAFPVFQTYGDSSVVRWDGAEDSNEPAAFVAVASVGSEDGSHEGHKHEHSEEAHSLSDTGGTNPLLFGAVGAFVLAATGLGLMRAVTMT